MIKILRGQSLLDIALQTTGSVEGVISISRANHLPITLPVDPLKLIDAAEEVDRKYRIYYEKRNIKPATELQVMQEDAGVFGPEFGVEFE